MSRRQRHRPRGDGGGKPRACRGVRAARLLRRRGAPSVRWRGDDAGRASTTTCNTPRDARRRCSPRRGLDPARSRGREGRARPRGLGRPHATRARRRRHGLRGVTGRRRGLGGGASIRVGQDPQRAIGIGRSRRRMESARRQRWRVASRSRRAAPHARPGVARAGGASDHASCDRDRTAACGGARRRAALWRHRQPNRNRPPLTVRPGPLRPDTRIGARHRGPGSRQPDRDAARSRAAARRRPRPARRRGDARGKRCGSVTATRTNPRPRRRRPSRLGTREFVDVVLGLLPSARRDTEFALEGA